MHAYAHQWSCQLKYNPRLQKGMGLSDGEGVERLWSRLRRLIGVTRMMGVSNLIGLLSLSLKHHSALTSTLDYRPLFGVRRARSSGRIGPVDQAEVGWGERHQEGDQVG